MGPFKTTGSCHNTTITLSDFPYAWKLRTLLGVGASVETGGVVAANRNDKSMFSFYLYVTSQYTQESFS